MCKYRLNTGAVEPSEDDEMNEMTLPSRHGIRDSSPGGLRSSTLHLGLSTILNLYDIIRMKKHFASLKLDGHSGVRACDLRLSKNAALTTAPGAPEIARMYIHDINPFKPEFTIVIFIHYKPRIAVAILDL